jgi:hypothetical protein
MHNGCWFLLGVVNSLNVLCFSMFLETSTSLSLSELLVESVKVDRFSSHLFTLLFALAILSTSG